MKGSFHGFIQILKTRYLQFLPVLLRSKMIVTSFKQNMELFKQTYLATIPVHPSTNQMNGHNTLSFFFISLVIFKILSVSKFNHMLRNGRLLTTTTAMFFQVLGWILFSSDCLRSPGILTL